MRVCPVPKAALGRSCQLRVAGERASCAVMAGTGAESAVAKRARERSASRVRAGGAEPCQTRLGRADLGRGSEPGLPVARAEGVSIVRVGERAHAGPVTCGLAYPGSFGEGRVPCGITREGP